MKERFAKCGVLAFLLAGCLAGSASIMRAEVSEDGLRLRLGLSTCNATHDFAIEESVEAVTIEAVITHREDSFFGGDDCMDMVVVDLPSPLGERRLIDATTGQKVAMVEVPTVE